MPTRPAPSPRDPLTGLANCHGFLVDVQRAVAAATQPIALVVIEPRLRAAGTRHGARLATIGRLLAMASGRHARVTRLDARRFAVFLPTRELAEAAAAAAHLRDALHVFFGAAGDSLSVAAGVAATPAGFGGTGEALIDLAVWRCETARLRGLAWCAAGAPSGELQQWPALAEPSLVWPDGPTEPTLERPAAPDGDALRAG